MSYTFQNFFQDLSSSIKPNGNKSIQLNQRLSLNIAAFQAQQIAQLQLSLLPLNTNQLNELIDRDPMISKLSWPAFENFILQYLQFVRNLDPWSVIDSVDLFIAVFEAESLLLNPKNKHQERITTMLLPHFQETMNIVIPLCNLVDTESMRMNNRRMDYPRLKHLSSILLKALNNIRSTPDLNDASNSAKIDLLMRVSIKLCEVYCQIGSPVLCANVFSNINILSLNKRLIKKSLLVRFRFLMGRYYAQQSNFLVAYHHLNACFQMIKLNTSPQRNVHLILKYLIPVGLIVGKLPNLQSLRQIDPTLFDIYGPIIVSYKAGDMYGFSKSILASNVYLKQAELWLQMIRYLHLGIFRNLAMRILRLTNELKFDQLRTGLRVSLEGTESLPIAYQVCPSGMLDEFVSNVVVSLCYNGYLKAKMVDLTSFVISKNDTFPDMYTVINGRYALNPREAWLDK